MLDAKIEKFVLQINAVHGATVPFVHFMCHMGILVRVTWIVYFIIRAEGGLHRDSLSAVSTDSRVVTSVSTVGVSL